MATSNANANSTAGGVKGGISASPFDSSRCRFSGTTASLDSTTADKRHRARANEQVTLGGVRRRTNSDLASASQSWGHCLLSQADESVRGSLSPKCVLFSRALLAGCGFAGFDTGSDFLGRAQPKRPPTMVAVCRHWTCCRSAVALARSAASGLSSAYCPLALYASTSAWMQLRATHLSQRDHSRIDGRLSPSTAVPPDAMLPLSSGFRCRSAASAANFACHFTPTRAPVVGNRRRIRVVPTCPQSSRRQKQLQIDQHPSCHRPLTLRAIWARTLSSPLTVSRGAFAGERSQTLSEPQSLSASHALFFALRLAAHALPLVCQQLWHPLIHKRARSHQPSSPSKLISPYPHLPSLSSAVSHLGPHIHSPSWISSVSFQHCPQDLKQLSGHLD
ncbi:hypothetical protein L1887_62530 [Cichorium endivia]|nr:hypothetical protein L1887_62530 [Cichorium endivia]